MREESIPDTGQKKGPGSHPAAKLWISLDLEGVKQLACPARFRKASYKLKLCSVLGWTVRPNVAGPPRQIRPD